MAENALGTYELLESILANLAPSDLFAAQQVSRVWRSLVHESLPVQRARCVHALLLTDLEVMTTVEYKFTYGALLGLGGSANNVNFIDDIANKTRVSWWSFPRRTHYAIEHQIALNPLLRPQEDRGDRRGLVSVPGQHIRLRLPDLHDLCIPAYYEEHISEPPISELVLEISPAGGNVLASRCAFRVETGITIADVYKVYRLMMEGEEKYAYVGAKSSNKRMLCEGKLTLGVCFEDMVFIEDV